METLILIAIAAFALLLTGLTGFQALRRPFRTKTGRTEEPAHGTGVTPPKAAFGTSDNRRKDGRRGA